MATCISLIIFTKRNKTHIPTVLFCVWIIGTYSWFTGYIQRDPHQEAVDIIYILLVLSSAYIDALGNYCGFVYMHIIYGKA